MTPAIKSLIRTRQQAFARGDVATWKLLRNEVQRKIKASKKTHYNTKINDLKNQHASQWHKEIKAMANINRCEPVINIEGLSPSDYRATADEINKTLSAVIQSLPPHDTSLLPAYLPAHPAPNVKPQEVYQKLQKVKTKKAAGPDGIPAKLVRELAYELSTPLADILNSSLVQGTTPVEWKGAIVVPIPKSRPPSVTELRPISLTSILGKVAESFVAEWAVSDIAPEVDPQQFGCLKGRSTTHCLLDFTHELFSDQPGTLCSLVPTDFSKAFDRVSHNIAICRLIELGLRPSLVRWISDFMTNRTQVVRYHGALSDSATVTCGFPQGTILGPLIFTAYINSASRQASSKRWKFVDDLNLLDIRHRSIPTPSLQQDLTDLDKWSHDQSMVLHPG
ncbi:hypothetical protein Bbelb_021790 [Branchiostoma belcheri]|nr:hypothetical protein Bbelb_021790 [Branchiostoma belcheri]